MNLGGTAENGCTPYGFLTWTHDLPFIKTGNASYSLNTATFVDRWGPPMLYLVATPDMMLVDWSMGMFYPLACVNSQGEVADTIASSTMLECQAVNSTYQSSFEYVNGSQIISVASKPISDHLWDAIQDVFTNTWDYTCNSEVLTTSENCNFEADLLDKLSYQAVMDAFQMLIAGAVYVDVQSTPGLVSTSGIASTILANTRELQFLKTYDHDFNIKRSQILQDVVATWSEHPGLVNVDNTEESSALAQALEEVYRMVVVSMMSSPNLQYVEPAAPVS